MRLQFRLLFYGLFLPCFSCLLLDTSGCGKSKMCISETEECARNLSCSITMSYARTGNDRVEIELWSRKSAGDSFNYLAVGFSLDEQMGEEPVTFCYSNNGKTGSGFSYNDGKSNRASADKEGDKKFVELVEFKEENGEVYCKIRQQTNIDASKRERADLSKDYFMLLARGNVNPDMSLGPHGFQRDKPDFPLVSTKRYSLLRSLSVQDNSAESAPGSGPFGLTRTTKGKLVSVHGVLMTVAWFAFIWNAVYAARYLKNHWLDKTYFGIQIWFHIHRSLNILGVLCIITAAVLVFVAKDFSWTGPTPASFNLSPGALHSLVGAISTILAFGQPIGALFRCGKDHPQRPIFNYAHRSAGLVGVALAVFAILLAAFNFDHLFVEPVVVRATIIVFLVLALGLAIGMEVFKYRNENENQKITAIELRASGKNSDFSTDNMYHRTHTNRYQSQNLIFTTILYLVVLVLSLITAIIVCYEIFKAM